MSGDGGQVRKILEGLVGESDDASAKHHLAQMATTFVVAQSQLHRFIRDFTSSDLSKTVDAGMKKTGYQIDVAGMHFHVVNLFVLWCLVSMVKENSLEEAIDIMAKTLKDLKEQAKLFRELQNGVMESMRVDREGDNAAT